MSGGAEIPLDKAYLTAIWLETLFYGINVLLFFSYLFIARYKARTRVNRLILPVAILMFCFSTIHVGLGFRRLIDGFIYLRDAEGGPAAFFSDVSNPANVAKVVIHTVNSILGDSIVVWRCYHVWGGSWLVCIGPILLILGSAVAGFGQGTIFAMAKDSHSAFVPKLLMWNGAVFSLSFVTNFVVTTLVALRIWWLARKLGITSRDSSFKYKRVLVLVVESGMIYSSAVLIEIVLYFLNSNAFYIVYDPIAQLTGIVPTMIIVISSLGLTSNDLNSAARYGSSKATSSGYTSSSRPSRPSGAAAIAAGGVGTGVGTYSLETRPQFAANSGIGTEGSVLSTMDSPDPKEVYSYIDFHGGGKPDLHGAVAV